MGCPASGLSRRSASSASRSARSRGVSGRETPCRMIASRSRRSTPLVCPSVGEVHGEIRDEELEAERDAERDARRRLALAQIRQYPDAALRMKAKPVEAFDDDLRRLAERMTALMVDAVGVGLAATQVGILQRLFVFVPGTDGEPAVIANPVITVSGDEVETDDEGCLSLQGVLAPVARGVASPRRQGRQRERCVVRARGIPGPNGAARARPSRRRPDHRSDDARGSAGSDGCVAPARRHRLVMARIAVAATAPFGADVLERLASRHEVVTVLTRPDAPRGRGRKIDAPPAKRVAESLGISVLQPARLEGDVDVDGGVHSSRVDAVVVAAYGLLIPDALLARNLWLNVHPSLLPRWRGAAPVARAVTAGDAETGVTIQRAEEELDGGPVTAQGGFAI